MKSSLQVNDLQEQLYQSKTTSTYYQEKILIL